MGRPPCCDKSNVKRGLWTPEEDAKILAYVSNHGIGNWTLVPKKAGFSSISLYFLTLTCTSQVYFRKTQFFANIFWTFINIEDKSSSLKNSVKLQSRCIKSYTL